MTREEFCDNFGISNRQFYKMTENLGPDGLINVKGHGYFSVMKKGLAKNSPMEITPVSNYVHPQPSAPSVPSDLMSMTMDDLEKMKLIEEIKKIQTVNRKSAEELETEIRSRVLNSFRSRAERARERLNRCRLSPEQIDEIWACLLEVFADE